MQVNVPFAFAPQPPGVPQVRQRVLPGAGLDRR
jgi:hypothetical protein